MIFAKAKQSFTFTSFLDYCTNEVALNEANPSSVENPQYAFYTKLNLQRMKRWIKTFELNQNVIDEIAKLPKQQWWLITETWCGDSAQNLPVIVALAAATDTSLTIVLRDENPEIIEQFLTNGTKSIPILVGFDMDNNQIFKWGPRPAAPQSIMDNWKAQPNGRDFDAIDLEMHQWYTKNKGNDAQMELLKLLVK